MDQFPPEVSPHVPPSAYPPPGSAAPAASYAPMPAGEAYSQGYRNQQREQYQALADNPIHSVAEAPVSTFSADVDTGAYANVRRLLNQGRLPPEGAVRLEEIVNYFPYDYALPTDQREVFLLRAHGDLDLPQIATLTETPLETVKSRLRYAQQKLRRLLAEEVLTSCCNPFENAG